MGGCPPVLTRPALAITPTGPNRAPDHAASLAALATLPALPAPHATAAAACRSS